MEFIALWGSEYTASTVTKSMTDAIAERSECYDSRKGALESTRANEEGPIVTTLQYKVGTESAAATYTSVLYVVQ